MTVAIAIENPLSDEMRALVGELSDLLLSHLKPGFVQGYIRGGRIGNDHIPHVIPYRQQT